MLQTVFLAIVRKRTPAKLPHPQSHQMSWADHWVTFGFRMGMHQMRKCAKNSNFELEPSMYKQAMSAGAPFISQMMGHLHAPIPAVMTLKLHTPNEEMRDSFCQRLVHVNQLLRVQWGVIHTLYPSCVRKQHKTNYL